MKSRNKLIASDKAIPVIKHDVFSKNPDRVFAIKNLGFGNDIEDRELFRAYGKLRKSVYVDQTGMLNKGTSSIDEINGTEFDLDDDRSSHFVVLENMGAERVGVVGCVRVIQKIDSIPLPVEDYFGDELPEGGTSTGSVEISRLISMKQRAPQLRAIRNLFSAALAHIDMQKLDNIYAIVEDDLERSLSYLGAKSHRIADPKWIEDYRSENVAIQIDKTATREHLGAEALKSMTLRLNDTKFWGNRSDSTQSVRRGGAA